MDISGFSCFVWVITACRCATEVAVTLFLTRRSPSLTVHKSALIRPLSSQALGSELAPVAQMQPLLWHHSLVSSEPPDLGPDCVLDTLALVASRHWPVAA